jgi:hypothetical protein
MYRQSRQETLYIDQTSIDVEIRREITNCLNEKNKPNIHPSRKKTSHSPTTQKLLPPMIYTLLIEGGMTDESELISYLNCQPLNVKFIETTNNDGQIIKTGAQVTLNDKELVDRILTQNHEK